MTNHTRAPERTRTAAAALSVAVLLAGCASGSGGSVGSPSVAPASSATAAATAVPTPDAVDLPTTAYHAVTIEGAPNTIAFTKDRVWVELHRSNSIAALEPKAFVATTYSDIAVHCSIAADGGDVVWAAYHQGDLLTRVDATSGKSSLAVTIEDACGTGAAEGQVWVTSPGLSKVFRIDPKSGKVLAEAVVPDVPFVVEPVGDFVYASGEGGGGWLYALDPSNAAIVAKRTSPDTVLIDAVALGDGSLWASGRLSNALYRLNPRTLATEATVDIGFEPSGVEFAEGAVWVSQLAGRLTKVDPATNTVVGRWALPYTWLSWPSFGFDRLWLTSLEENAVIAVDLGAVPAH